MKKLLFSFAMICSFTLAAKADLSDQQNNDVNSYSNDLVFRGMDGGHHHGGHHGGGHGGGYPGYPGGGHGGGHHGGYPGGGYPPPSQPPPYPHPQPGYPPPPSHGIYHQYIDCGSYNWGYNECFIDSSNLHDIRIYRQFSAQPCIWGQTAGFNYNRIWVNRGCAATFDITRYY